MANASLGDSKNVAQPFILKWSENSHMKVNLKKDRKISFDTACLKNRGSNVYRNSTFLFY